MRHLNEINGIGELHVRVISKETEEAIEKATVVLSFTGEPGHEIRTKKTDSKGSARFPFLEAPNIKYSFEPMPAQQPYALYTLKVKADGYEDVMVSGIEILPDVTAIQTVYMQSGKVQAEKKEPIPEEIIVIPGHTLYESYPPKIEEAEIKPIPESGEIVLSKVVIPEYIVVHDGAPNDSTARDHYVRYRDYIKNVASSEIYATWPDATIRANVLAIMSFTLNRVYTEWYRNKNYTFTITSSTAFDQKWIPGRNIYNRISKVVDEMYGNYLARPHVKQPILTQYCDGKNVNRPGWMTQWGSKELGEKGYSAIQILRHFYGKDLYIHTAESISGIPASWPGYVLKVGSKGSKVRHVQHQLAVIAKSYPAIPKIHADGIYGKSTERAVRKFQEVFGLPQTGSIDYRTWYKISEIYVGVSGI